MLSAQALNAWARRLEDQAGAKPADVRVSAFTWRQYLMTGGAVFCPVDRELCRNKACRLGTRCATLAAEKGQTPGGEALPRRQRPTCDAKTRAGGECQMRVEPGKHRCRLHGGLSTGPKTTEGRARIAEAQRRRWGSLSGSRPTPNGG